MRAFEFLWVVFLIVVAEIGRYWQPLRQNSAAYGSRIAAPRAPRPLQGQRKHSGKFSATMDWIEVKMGLGSLSRPKSSDLTMGDPHVTGVLDME